MYCTLINSQVYVNARPAGLCAAMYALVYMLNLMMMICFDVHKFVYIYTCLTYVVKGV
jgi:hypothetical protein